MLQFWACVIVLVLKSLNGDDRITCWDVSRSDTMDCNKIFSVLNPTAETHVQAHYFGIFKRHLGNVGYHYLK